MNKKHRNRKARFNNFWAKVKRPKMDCWLWTGAVYPNTNNNNRSLLYGKAWYRGKLQKAHRVAWQIRNGDIPKGLCVLHQCDRPLCVRPEHLMLGTQADNIRDMVRKKRNHTAKDKNGKWARKITA